MFNKAIKTGGVKPGIAQDVFGQLLETGKKTTKTAKSQLSAGKFLQTATSQAKGVPESGNGQQKTAVRRGQKIKGVPVTQLTEAQFEEIKRQRDIQSTQQYQEIQRALDVLQKKQAQETPKSVSGKPGFDQEALTQQAAAGGKPQKPEGLGPLVEPTSRARRGLFMGRGKMSRKQKQTLGTKELGKVRSG